MHKLQQILESADIETRSYSGRGMYGESCLAVSLNSTGEMFAALVEGSADLTPGERVDVARVLQGTQHDQMGRGTVYYWRGVEFEGESSEEEEAEDS